MEPARSFFRDAPRLRLPLAALAVLAVGLPPASPAVVASPSPLHHYLLAGVEARATSTVGTFVGGAADPQLDGMLWKAVVRHAPLSRTGTPSPITGGSVTLHVASATGFSTQSRSFTAGTIAYAADLSSRSACGRQAFRVNATLAPTSEADGSGSLDVYLTHHRRSLFGQCITYAATVRGSLDLTGVAA
jgi:hypothetical protein